MTLPTGSTLRPEFRPQHDGGREAPAGKSGSNANPAPNDAGSKQDGANTPKQGAPVGLTDGCGGPQIVMLGGMLLVFYFLLLRPQQKQEKKLREMRSALKKGDRVVMTGGMHAIVTQVDDKVITVTPTADGPTMRFDASAIGRVITDEVAAANVEGNKGD